MEFQNEYEIYVEQKQKQKLNKLNIEFCIHNTSFGVNRAEPKIDDNNKFLWWYCFHWIDCNFVAFKHAECTQSYFLIDSYACFCQEFTVHSFNRSFVIHFYFLRCCAMNAMFYHWRTTNTEHVRSTSCMIWWYSHIKYLFSCI